MLNIWREKNHGNSDIIRIGQEIQCLPYAGFLHRNKKVARF